ncbi:MAG: hypothetical protein HY460_00485, partial [Parcubacteria group bacterium]|nr:hypothetical protein [Parcubacteria group bacterium]
HQRYIIARGIHGVTSYTWHMPVDVLLGTYWVRIANEDGSISDVSREPITVVDRFLEIVTPNGGETFTHGSSAMLQWESDRLSDQIRILLMRSGVLMHDFGLQKNSGYYSAAFPLDLPSDLTYTFLLRDSIHAEIEDASDAFFTIGDVPALPETTPKPTVPPEATPALADGDLVRGEGDFRVWVIQKNGETLFRRHLFGPQIFSVYPFLRTKSITLLTAGVLSAIPESTLVRIAWDTRVFHVTAIQPGVGARAQWIRTPAEFRSRGYSWDAVYRINSEEFSYYRVTP